MATRWTVVGGQDAGGILVRDGCSLTSALKNERLSTGAIVEQLTFAANRFQFRKVSGKGPSDGWVSVTVNGRVLLKRFKLSCGPQFIDLVKADNSNPVVSKRPVAKPEVAEKQQVYHADFCVKYACCIRPAGHQGFCVNNDLEEMRPAPKLGLYSGLAIDAAFPGDNINIHIMLQESCMCLERTPTRSFFGGGSPPRQEFGTWVFQASTLTVKLSKEELQVRVGGLDSKELSLKGAVCHWQRPLNQEELDAMVEQLEVATLEKQRREAEERVAQEREAKIQAAWEREEAMEADVIRQRRRQLRRERVAEAARRVEERQHHDEAGL